MKSKELLPINKITYMTFTEAEKNRIANRVRQIYLLNFIRDNEKRTEGVREEFEMFLTKLKFGYLEDKEE